ncbi:hypothetical protein [Microtetraspora niveoalba]|uniref:hypothetical protein n=1 Tax=Microtetraspora niveoalba TaxID=46175 RepID=UPI000A7778F7|nr:hypothetical protein [Microtetraspora niveoalba]
MLAHAGAGALRKVQAARSRLYVLVDLAYPETASPWRAAADGTTAIRMSIAYS